MKLQDLLPTGPVHFGQVHYLSDWLKSITFLGDLICDDSWTRGNSRGFLSFLLCAYIFWHTLIYCILMFIALLDFSPIKGHIIGWRCWLPTPQIQDESTTYNYSLIEVIKQGEQNNIWWRNFPIKNANNLLPLQKSPRFDGSAPRCLGTGTPTPTKHRLGLGLRIRSLPNIPRVQTAEGSFHLIQMPGHSKWWNGRGEIGQTWGWYILDSLLRFEKGILNFDLIC